MAANDVTDREAQRQNNRRRAALSSPVADEGDVAFGALAGIAVLAAILAAMFAFFGYAGGAESTESTGPAIVTPPVTEPTDDGDGDTGPDLAEILAALGGAGYEGLELSADGAVVTAKGEVVDEDARTEVLALIGAQRGVDTVIDQLTIPAVDPGEAAAVLSVTDDSIALGGTVGSASAADELRTIAAEVYESAQITDGLEIVDGAQPATVTLRGILTDATTAAALREALDGVDAALVDELVVDADASEEINAILELEPILFQSATAIILPDSQPTLEEAARILQFFPEAQVEIGGHTDSLGPDEANRALSENRAQAVLQSLRDLGVTNELTAVGYGESQLKFPDDKGDTPDKIEARQANRRIEFRTLN